MPPAVTRTMRVLLGLAFLTACVATADHGSLAISSSTSGKADGDNLLTVEQGHVPLDVSLECGTTDCDITFTLTPTAYTQKLMTKKLAGKAAADLPLAVLHQKIGSVDQIADLRPDDGSGDPVVATLADGTPVVFHGASVHVTQSSILALQMDVAFWYNEVDFNYAAVFADPTQH